MIEKSENLDLKLTDAHDAGAINTASIRVDVLSLSPTTHRSTTSRASTSQKTVSTKASTPEVLSITTPLITTTKSKGNEAITSEREEADVTTSVNSKFEATTVLNEEAERAQTTSKEDESATTGKEEERTTRKSEEDETSTANPISDLAELVATSAVITGNSSLPTTSTSPQTTESDFDAESTTEQKSTEEVTAEPLEESLDKNNDGILFTTSPEIFPDPQTLPSQLIDPEPSEDISTTSFLDGQESTKIADRNVVLATESNDVGTTEGSGASFEVTTEEISGDMRIIVEGTNEDKFKIDSSVEKGSMVRGIAVSVVSKGKKKSYTKLSLEDDSVFDIRPKQLYSGNKAYLFVKSPSLLGTSNTVKIVAEDKHSVANKEFTITTTALPSRTTAEDDLEAKIETTTAVEYVVSIPEDAPPGSTVYQIVEGSAKKVVGPPGM
ncbi:unnamed protein product [Strongylus vulgaris]|uniref:Uncharacterized protein n=1 Tax=Strongylus vulgaris TaxID=40348 RepID=A0A3P7ID67_STRVU|nr:unnamed protein product [Strongylus vulgaris]